MTGRLFKRGRVWYTHVHTADGRREQRSTRCTDRRAASLVERRLQQEAADPGAAEARRATLEDLLELLLADRTERARAGRRSFETVASYRTKCGHWLRLLGRDLPAASLTATKIDGYISQRRQEGAADATIHKELVVLRGALRLALRRGLWRGDPAEVLPVAFAPAYQPRTRALTREELQRLLPRLRPDHAARVAFIIATSACWSEAERAERTDVAGAGDEVTIRGTKRATRARVVPVVCSWQLELLRYALQHAGGAERLFRPWSNVRRDLVQACAAAGIEPVSPNDLRRTCGRWLRAEGLAPHVIALVMGHGDGRMVERVYGRPQGAELGALVRHELGRRDAGVVEDLVDAVRRAAEVAAAAGVSAEDVAAALRVARAASSLHQTGGHRMDRPDRLDARQGDFPADFVPRDGIEPPTRGFSSQGGEGSGGHAGGGDRRVAWLLPAPRRERAASPVQHAPAAAKRGAR